MITYGSFQAQTEVMRGEAPAGKLFRASNVTTGESTMLKIVPASGAKQEAIMAAFMLQQELGAMPRSRWLPLLEYGYSYTECYAVFECAEPQLVKDIESMFEPSAVILGQTCQGILEALILLKKHPPGRAHGNLKPSNVLFRQTAAGETDYSQALLTDMLPVYTPGQGPAKSDLRALGVLLYQFVRSDKRTRQSIPDEERLWPMRTEKQDAGWRLFISRLMSGDYDDHPLETALRDAKRLSGTQTVPGKWIGLGLAALAVAGAAAYFLLHHAKK
jgi:hypothetical protein